MIIARTKMTFKMIAVLIAAIFLWNQIVWAADLPGSNQYGSDPDTQPAGFSPEVLDQFQALQNNAISHKQVIEDFVYQHESASPAEPPMPETLLSFDGVDDYIVVSDSDDLSFGDGETSQPMTIVADVYFEQNGTSQIILSKAGEYSFGVGSQGGLYFQQWDNNTNGSAGLAMAMGVYVSDGRHQVAITFNGTGGRDSEDHKLFVDGVEVEAWDIGGYIFNAMENTDSDLIIGGGGTHLWQGDMYEIRLYGTELSTQEISELYEEADISEALISDWDFTEGSGLISEDSWGVHNGTIYGAAWTDKERSTIITEEGNIAYFLEDELKSIKTKDGIIITEIVYKGIGELINARVEYTDGSCLLINNGRVVSVMDSEGNIKLSYEYDFEGNLCAVYEYDIENGMVIMTIADGATFKYYSSPHGQEYTTKTVETNGWTCYYLGEILKEKRYSDGRAYVYKERYQDGRIKTTRYYSPGDIFIWESVDYYDEDGRFSGKTVTYGNGRIHEKDKNYQDTRITYSGGEYVVYTRDLYGRITYEAYYDSADQVLHTYEYIYGEDGRQTGKIDNYADGRSYHYDSEGYIVKEVLSGGYYFLYKGDRFLGRARITECYTPSGELEKTVTYNDDETGMFTTRTIEYPSDKIYEQNRYFQNKKITYANGEYIIYNRLPDGRDDSSIYYKADESILYSHVYNYDLLSARAGSVKTYTDGRNYYYDIDGRLEKLIEGLYEEERRYVLSGGNVLYTTALNRGKIKTVQEGYYSGTELISKKEEEQSTISVTYDNNITVNYMDGMIKSLSAEDGYMNFYSGDSIDYQHSSKGDLYSFEDNLLRQIATVRGNIYNFENIIDSSGVSVFLSSGVIGGMECKFSGSRLSAVYKGGMRINILDLIIKNNLEVETIKIDSGDGEEELAEDDPLFNEIRNILATINEDIPNIQFDYSSELIAQKILTSDYSWIYFNDNLISKTVSTEGEEVLYDYIKDGDNITGLRMFDGGAVRMFDAAGKLVSVEFNGDGKTTTVNFEAGELAGMESAGEIMDDISFDVDGNIDAARLLKTDGSEYFFMGGKLENFITGENVNYEVDPDGRIIRVTQLNTSEVFNATYFTDQETGRETIMFTSEGTLAKYLYVDGVLAVIIDPAGFTINYTYDIEGRTEKIDISYGGQRTSTYIYEYIGQETVITDDIGTKRIFDENGDAIRLETPYGETYFYAYDIDEKGNPITIVNYTQKDKGDGLVIQYFKGKIQRIDKPDGSWIDNIEFDQATQELRRFSIHTADGKHHNIITEGKFIQFEMEDSTRLIFYENTLVAFAGSQGIVPLYNEDIEELEDLIYSRDRSSSSGSQPAEADVAAASWRHQTYQDSQAINFVERDYVNNQWEVSLDLKTGDAERSKGEMYIDLRYDIPGLEWQAPIDMKGKEISFMFKLDESFEYDPGTLCDIQVFAKDENWNTQYGTKIEMVESSDWIKVSLVPTKSDINFGYTESGFDPSSIVMIGLRISEPDSTTIGRNHFGKVYIKHDILPDLFANVSSEDSPLDDLYSGLGMVRDLDRLQGETEVTDAEAVLESFADALAEGPSDIFQKSMLKQVSWNVESEDPNIKGINSVYRDVDSGEFILDVDLSSTGDINKEGEIYIDLSKNVPGLNWSEPVNFTLHPIKMLVNIPPELVGSQYKPNGVRIFVEDENMNMQYGTWVNLKEANKWYQIELTPTFGEVPMGYTDEEFDPSKIRRIGVSLATQEGSNTSFEGDVRLKFLDGSGDSDAGEVLNTPLWMDLRNVQKYLLDDNDNYVRVPNLSYLSEDDYSYVFNRGSGVEPTANLDVLEASSTNWKSESSSISAPRWNGSESLLVDMDMSTNVGGIFYLDVRYPNHVPGMNWPEGSSLDMSRYQTTYYVRTTDNFTGGESALLTFTGFAKDRLWHIEYDEGVEVLNDGEWHKVTFTPLPYDFNSGVQYYSSFDPTNISMFGLQVKNSSGAPCSGTVEFRYEINSIDLGVNGLGDTGNLPDNPVWVNQRELGDYLIQNEIGLYADYAFMEDIKALAEEIPQHCLPTDFAAMTIYDKDDEVISISKPDGTTTYFNDNDQIDYIAFEDGSIFINYGYDTKGDLISATLTSARRKLSEAIDETVLELEKETADTLLLLAEQHKLLEENFMEDVNAQRSQFASFRSQLEAQRYVEIEHSFLWWTWTTRVENPAVVAAIADLNRQEAEFNRQVAEELAKLSVEISEKRDEILVESGAILDEYAWQEKKLFLAILHQEAIPILHYYYRTGLGRDATEEEIKAVFKQIDENENFAGFLENDIDDIEALAIELGLDQASPVFTLLSQETQDFITTPSSQWGEARRQGEDRLMQDLDVLIKDQDLYAQLTAYYGSEEDLHALLTDKTLAYIQSHQVPDEKQSQWINRCTLQDLFPQLVKKYADSEIFSAAILKNQLTSSNEYLNSYNFKQNITNQVVAFLDQYLQDPASRPALLSSLGLTADETIEINNEFVQSITVWLDGQDIHFGKSAFGTLKKLLNENASEANYEDLAKQALLTDILLGITGPTTDETIEISMYTMSHVASLYGAKTSSARLTYADIINGQEPFITLIKGHHYVTVTSVTETEVTYWDESIGEAGRKVVISRDDFEENWEGNTITTDQSISPEKLLTVQEAKHIKGAFFFSILIGALIAGLANAIGGLVSIVIGTITALVTGLATFVGNLMAGLVHCIANIGSMLSFGMGKFLGTLGIGAAASGAAGGAATVVSGFSLSTLVHGAGATLLKIGIGYGVSVGLESLGVDPIVSGILSSTITGGVSGLLGPGGSIGLAFKSAIQWGASATASMLGTYFDVNPVITSILSMSTGALTGAALDPTVSFKEALSTVSKNVIGELAYYGVQVAGQAMGIDPNISYLAGIGIRSSLQAGLSGFGAGGLPLQEMWNAAIEELTQPVNLALAFNIAGDAIGLDPMINNMIITAVAGAIDGFNENPESRITGMFKGMLNNFWDASVRALTFGLYDPIEGGWNQDIQRNYAIMNLTNFINVVMEEGIEAAIENHLTTIFRDEAIRVINERGGIADFLTGEAEMIEENGYWLKQINVTDEDKLYLNPDTNEIVGRDYGDIKERGEYGTNPYTGGFGLVGGVIEQTTENGTRMVYHVSGSTVIDKMEVYGESGGYIQVIATDPETGLQLNENGIPLGGIVADFENGKIYKYECLGDSVDFELNFDNPNVSVQDIASIDLSTMTDEEKKEVIQFYTLANGINNKNINGSPSYMVEFGDQLAIADPTAKETMIPLYNEFYGYIYAEDLVYFFGNLAGSGIFNKLHQGGYINEDGTITNKFFELNGDHTKLDLNEFNDFQKEIYDLMWQGCNHILEDGIGWLMDIFGDKQEVTNDIITDKIVKTIQDKFTEGYPTDLVGLCYSGAGDPYLQAINKQAYDGTFLDVEAVVLVGTPMKFAGGKRVIENTNVHTLLNIYGEKDMFKSVIPSPDYFEGNANVANIYNFEIMDCGHGDYFYDTNNLSDDPEINELRQDATKFIAKVTALSRDVVELYAFINKQKLTGAIFEVDGVLRVDVKRITYETID